MSTSGSYSFNLNKTQIITEAFSEINVYDPNQTIDADDYAIASNKLNLMLKTWEGEGVHMWKRRLATLFPALNQYSYQLGSVTGADNCTNTYVSTTVSSAVSASSSTIIVVSASGLSNGMNIGLELDDGTRQWGTVSNISGTTLTVSFSTTTTSASGNTVVAYTNKINRPLNIMRMTRVDLKNSSMEAPLMPISYDQYFNMPLKTISGLSTNFYYDKLLSNSLPYTGTLYLFPQPSLVSTVITFSYNDSIQDMINSNDSLDLPQEWLETVIINLACRLAPKYGKQQELAALQPLADKLKLTLENFDNDDTNLRFRPDLDGFTPSD